MKTVRYGFTEGISLRWKSLKGWLRDGKPLWWWVGIGGVICAIAYLFPVNVFSVSAELADRVRWAGMLLQFVGVWTVALGLKESRKLFNKAPILRTAIAWIARFRHVVILPQKRIVEGVGIAVGLASEVDAAGAVVPVMSRPTLEMRVANLEHAMTETEKRISDLRDHVSNIRSDTRANIDRERQERAEQHRKIAEQLETAMVGGIHLELSGVFYLLVGIMFGTIPAEVASGLKCIGL